MLGISGVWNLIVEDSLKSSGLWRRTVKVWVLFFLIEASLAIIDGMLRKSSSLMMVALGSGYLVNCRRIDFLLVILD